MAILICSGLLYPTGWAAQPPEDIHTVYHGFCFKGRETFWEYNTVFIYDEYERVTASLGKYCGTDLL
jgi:hypothetical protein